MIAVVTVFHIFVCITLIAVVLLQAGRGAGMGGVFGAASSTGQQIFGGRGASSFLGKLTAGLAVVFMLTSISLTLMGGTGARQRSVIREAMQETMPGGSAPGSAAPGQAAPGSAPSGTAAPGAGAPAGEGVPPGP